MEVVIITGISGAGKTSVINICQDNNYYTIDNLPPKFILKYLEEAKTEKVASGKFAFVTDVRLGEKLEELEEVISKLRENESLVKMIFLDASTHELIRRFQEKRRPHFYNDMSLEAAINLEREKMEKIKQMTDYYIDTTGNNLYQLRNRLLDILEIPTRSKIQIISFGFKNGTLREADYLFDVRFIENPYYIEELRPKNGKQKEIIDFVKQFPETHIFTDKIVDLIDFLMENFNKLGKHNLVIGIGCTGGKHRSVVIAEMIHERIKEKYSSSVFHREKNLW